MKVVLLAAGRSKRLKPIEDKNFLNFLGKPLILHQLEQLSAAGLNDVVMVGGAHNFKKLRALAKNLPKKMTVTVVEQKDLDEGMAGAMIAVKRAVKSQPMMVVSGNDVVDLDAYQKVLKASKEKNIDGLMLGKKVTSYFPGGYLKVRSNGQITGIVEKPGAGKEPGKLVNLVVHFFRDSKAFISTVKNTTSSRDDRYEVAIDRMIRSGSTFKVVPYEGFWQPIKYPWHVISVMNHFLGKISWRASKNGKKAQIAKSAVIQGNVFLDEGVIIGENAVVVGPAYLGNNVILESSAKIRGNVYLDDAVIVSENALVRSSYVGKASIVGTNSMVRSSNVGANCVIGFGSEIARSYLGDTVWTHTNYVGDSIIGNNCSFGAGTVTGNLRLDEKNIPVNIQGEKIDSGTNKFGLITGENVRCGINTSFMPGVKIGNNSFVGAGIVVAQDVEDNKFVYGRTELIIKENSVQLDPSKRTEMQKKMGNRKQ